MFFHPSFTCLAVKTALKQDVNSPRGNRESIGIEFIAKNVFHNTICVLFSHSSPLAVGSVEVPVLVGFHPLEHFQKLLVMLDGDVHFSIFPLLLQ